MIRDEMTQDTDGDQKDQGRGELGWVLETAQPWGRREGWRLFKHLVSDSIN